MQPQRMIGSTLSSPLSAPSPAGFFGTGKNVLSLGGLNLSESTYTGGFKMPRHDHESAYFGIVLDGAFTEVVGRDTRSQTSLATAFHPDGETHQVEFHQTLVRIFRLEFTAEWRERLQLTDKFPAVPIYSGGGHLSTLAVRVRREFRRRDEWSPLSIEGLALEIIAELARATVRAAEARGPKWLDRVVELLTADLAEPPSLSELSRAVGVHPVTIAREFRSRFGCTTGDFVRKHRIEFARREILRSDAPLSHIALEAGFYDQSHFTNTFKRFTGHTPAEYRAFTKNKR